MSRMDVPGASLNRSVPQNLFDRESVRARVGQPCAGCMPKIMEPEVPDLGLTTCGVESFLDLGQIQAGAFADEDEFAVRLLAHPQ